MFHLILFEQVYIDDIHLWKHGVPTIEYYPRGTRFTMQLIDDGLIKYASTESFV
jgi:hypothetical protein